MRFGRWAERWTSHRGGVISKAFHGSLASGAKAAPGSVEPRVLVLHGGADPMITPKVEKSLTHSRRRIPFVELAPEPRLMIDRRRALSRNRSECSLGARRRGRSLRRPIAPQRSNPTLSPQATTVHPVRPSARRGLLLVIAAVGLLWWEVSAPAAHAQSGFLLEYARSHRDFLEQLRRDFASHLSTAGGADLAREALEAGGFLDYHEGALDEWIEVLQEDPAPSVPRTTTIFHNGSQALSMASIEALQLLVQLDSWDGPIDREANRARIAEVIRTCFLPPPAGSLADCPLGARARVSAAHPFTVLSGTWDDEAELELELTVENVGELDAEDVVVEATTAWGELVDLSGGPCRRVEGAWRCELGDLPVGARRELVGRVDVGIDPSAGLEIFTEDELALHATSDSTELDPVQAVGGFGWQAIDCDRRYRRALASLDLATLDEAMRTARTANPELPRDRLFEPSDSSGEATRVVNEQILFAGPDAFLHDENGMSFRRVVAEYLAREGAAARCENGPPEVGPLRGGSPLPMRREATENLLEASAERVRAATREIEIAMRVANRALPVDAEPLDVGSDKGTKWLANQLAGWITQRATDTAWLGTLLGVWSAAANTGQAIELGAAAVLLQYTEVTVLSDLLADMEELAYLRGLLDRYAALEETQESVLQAIEVTYLQECFCKR